MKHRVEESTRSSGVSYLQVDQYGRRWAGPYLYIANGAFIEAARLEGYRVERCSHNNLNAFFNLAIRRRPIDVVHVFTGLQ